MCGVRVLGVDPGLTRCGFGVVEGTAGRRPVLVDVGVIRTAPDLDTGARLVLVADGLAGWLDRHHPDVLALERVFAQHNLRTVMGTAQVSGLVLDAAARRGIPVALHTPSEVKAAVVGTGRAGKAEVGTAVRRVLGLAEVPRPPDAADALALAICQVWRGAGLARLAAAHARARPAVAGTRSSASAAAGTRPPVPATAGSRPSASAVAR